MAIEFSGYHGRVDLKRIPDSCPICHHAIEPRFMQVAHAGIEPAERFAELLFQCPRQRCQRLFLARYYDTYGYGSYDLVECTPKTILSKPFSEPIRKISPVFCEIYDEASQAEQMHLLQVCGP